LVLQSSNHGLTDEEIGLVEGAGPPIVNGVNGLSCSATLPVVVVVDRLLPPLIEDVIVNDGVETGFDRIS
jgi:hypothetical protein